MITSGTPQITTKLPKEVTAPESNNTTPEEVSRSEVHERSTPSALPEIKPPPIPEINKNQTTSLDGSTCPPGWDRFNQSCYQHITQPRNWTSARSHCLVFGGDLASIHSPSENDFVSEILTKNVTSTMMKNDKRMNNDYLQISATTKLYTSGECKNTYQDILFVVDGSGSIGTSEFPKIKNFLKLLVDNTDVGLNKTQFGMVEFSDDQWSEFSLNSYRNNKEVKGNELFFKMD